MRVMQVGERVSMEKQMLWILDWGGRDNYVRYRLKDSYKAERALGARLLHQPLVTGLRHSAVPDYAVARTLQGSQETRSR